MVAGSPVVVSLGFWVIVKRQPAVVPPGNPAEGGRPASPGSDRQLAQVERVVGRVPIELGRVSVGSAPGCDLRLEGVPPLVAWIETDDRRVILTPFDASGQSLGPRAVAWGDSADVGDFRLRRIRGEARVAGGTAPLRTASGPLRSKRLRLELPSGPAEVPPGGAADLGRDPGNDFVIEGEAVSGFHCRIEAVEDGGWRVRDRSSTNGTYIDGVRVEGARLPPRGVLRVADVEIPIGGSAPATTESFYGLVGASAPMQALFRNLERVAGLDEPVLVLGETGTGKELVARAIHALSSRCKKTFLAKNCGAIPEALADAELFGAVRGAFSGAEDRPGAFEAAAGGTVFLDELGELPLAVQPKLLRAIQERRVARLGTQHEREVSFRLVAATHRDLASMADEGRFRSDLHHRVNVFEIRVPPLRSRPEDIPALVRHLMGGTAEVLSDSALDALKRYRWPGNVRELRNVLLRANAFRRGARIEASDLELRGPAAEPLRPATPRRRGRRLKADEEERQRRETLQAWEASNRSISEAARLLAIAKSTMFQRKQKYGLPERPL